MFDIKKQQSRPTAYRSKQHFTAQLDAAIADAIASQIDLRDLATVLEDKAQGLRVRDACTRPI
jgi:hypothetical protein